MTDEEKAEEYIINKYKLNKCYIEDTEETRVYMHNDVHSEYEEEYQIYLDGLAEGRKETTYMKADEFDKSLDKCRECDLIAEQKKQIDQLSVDNHVLKTAFIEQQGVIDNLKEEIADPKVAMKTIKKYCIEISEKYGNCSKCVFCSKGYNGCKLQTSPDNWEV